MDSLIIGKLSEEMAKSLKMGYVLTWSPTSGLTTRHTSIVE